MQPPQRQRGKDGERVDMALVVRDDHERAVGEVLRPVDPEPVVEAQPGAQQKREKGAHGVDEEVRFARKVLEALNRPLLEVERGVVLPRTGLLVLVRRLLLHVYAA
ncbi:MAG: hypothetical protein ACYTGZ_17210 [Planctomycetota bacterium]|jgi:hypothetical protein